MDNDKQKNTAPIQVDLERVIADKNPKLLKLMPGFLIRYLKKVIHQDDLNQFLKDNKDVKGLSFVKAALDRFEVNIKLRGVENIPKDGRFLVAANHPLGGLDGLALISAIGSVRENVLFPVNDILMNLPNLRELFIPVNKHGSNANNIRILDNTFAGDSTILYFPAGLCSRKKNKEIVDLEWKKTFITKSRKYKRNILPVHVSGKNSTFFYRLSNFRQFLGIKANIEMLYLVDEMFKQKDKDLIITFGDMISYETFDKSKTDKEWAKYIKKYVYSLQ